MVDEMGWWAIPIVSLVIFTLYGIEGIGSQLEDPFGYDRNDINMDALVGDTKTEIDVVLSEWRQHCKMVEGSMNVRGGETHGNQCLDAGGNGNGITLNGGRDKASYVATDLFLKSRPRTAT
jgi:putative membrane protein